MISICLGRDGETLGAGPDYYARFREAQVENEFGIRNSYTLSWDKPNLARSSHLINTGPISNIRRVDYVGADACRGCHPEIYRKWTSHSHRRMNQLALPENVVGDFSGVHEITYRGVKGSFFVGDGRYHMALEQGRQRQVYRIERTIGSRFYQYYTGVLVANLEVDPAELHHHEVVLPFGYWIDRKEWVPSVHVYHEVDGDDNEGDLLQLVADMTYDFRCSQCHTTIPWGNMLVRKDGRERMTEQSPREVLFHYGGFLKTAYPDLAKKHLKGSPPSDQQIEDLLVEVERLSTRKHAANLGISCEACHHGGRAHVENSTTNETHVTPAFYPESQFLSARGESKDSILSRNSANKNFLCAKCHVGTRVEYASGHHAWNSTEYSDARRGACYAPARAAHGPDSTLTCVHCHDPHEGIGQSWRRTRLQDNQSCTHCHQELTDPVARQAHTHHAADSIGSDCMNCHMPKINEGLQDLVRTHRIFSPSNKQMIERNQPNACNMCHVEETLDWTLAHLDKWYERDYDREAILTHAEDPNRPATINWLLGDHQPSRMVAGGVLVNARARWALPELVGALDDPALMNRQFLQKGLDDWLDQSVTKSGYEFYLPVGERNQFIDELKRQLELPDAMASGANL